MFASLFVRPFFSLTSVAVRRCVCFRYMVIDYAINSVGTIVDAVVGAIVAVYMLLLMLLLVLLLVIFFMLLLAGVVAASAYSWRREEGKEGEEGDGVA